MAPPMDLLELRNHTKRDPSGYHAEFLLQYRHFQTQLQIFLLKPSEDYKPFSDLVEYLCHVSDLYSKDMPDFAEQISNLLEKNCDILASQLRRSLVSALILLRSKNQITPHRVLSLFFKLFRCRDANLREMLHKHIVNDITNINKKHKNQNLNHALQNFMFTMMKDPNEMAAKESLKVMIELYRKRVWNDAKTVNVISTGVFSSNTNVVASSLKFFLTIAADDEEDRIAEQKEKAKLTIKKMNLKLGVRKLGHGGEKKAKKAISDANVQRMPQRKLDPNWPAIELINDPQGYTDKVFAVTRSSFERIEVRLMLMNFISRLIFTHKLIVLNFYPLVQRYLLPKNEHVTYALSLLAQGIHDLIPPTDLQPIVKHIVDKFVHDRSSNESVICGLHTLREMCNRNPLILSEALVKDLAAYKNNKDKGINTAARGLIGVFRVHNPALLERKDRGKVGNMNKEKPLEYGEVRASSGVSDIELLQRIKLIQQQEKRNQSGKIAAEVDLEGNVIAYESDEEEEEEGEEEGEEGEGEWMEVEDGEGDEDEEDDEEEDGEEDGEDDGEDEEEEEEEEIVIPTKKAKKDLKGGVVGGVGVMSIAEALKLEKMQRDAIDAQMQKIEKRKRGEDYEDDEEEEEEDDEDEDDEDEDEEEEEEVQEEDKEPEIDIFSQIDMLAADDSFVPVAPKNTTKVATQNGNTKPQNGNSKEAVVQPRKNAWPPTKKKAKLDQEIHEIHEIDEDDDDDEDDVLEEVDSEELEEMSDEEEEVEEVKEVKKPAPKKKKPTETKKEKKQDTVEIAEPEINLDQPIDQSMILTEADFVLLARLKEMKADGKISLARLKDLTQELEEEDSDTEVGGLVEPSSLTRGLRKEKKDLAERMQEKLEKQASREKRTKVKTRLTTNEENTKKKNLMMIVKGKKNYAKGKMSFRDNQVRKNQGKAKSKRFGK